MECHKSLHFLNSENRLHPTSTVPRPIHLLSSPPPCLLHAPGVRLSVPFWHTSERPGGGGSRVTKSPLGTEKLRRDELRCLSDRGVDGSALILTMRARRRELCQNGTPEWHF